MSRQENSVIEFRFSHVWDDEIVPVERYFTASSPEEALEMFAYTCLKTGRKPILEEFAKWDRWAQSWTLIPIPERDEYSLGENALIVEVPEEAKQSGDEGRQVTETASAES